MERTTTESTLWGCSFCPVSFCYVANFSKPSNISNLIDPKINLK